MCQIHILNFINYYFNFSIRVRDIDIKSHFNINSVFQYCEINLS